MLNLLIDTIKFFNQVTESVEENPEFFVNLVNKNLGKNFGSYVNNKLNAELALNQSDNSTPESYAQNDMDFEDLHHE